jgi:L-serine dehydratase
MLSILDLFRVGVGPSSSHTVGPMRAARRFAEELEAWGRLARTVNIGAELYGSLALTGKGHGTDRAILLGLLGESPEVVDPATIHAKIWRIHESHRLRLLGTSTIAFDPEKDLIFHCNSTLSGHSNGMRFTAYGYEGCLLDRRIYYSVGGGFIVEEGEEPPDSNATEVPYPFDSAADLLRMGREHKKEIWEMVLENETALRPEMEVRLKISCIWQEMKDCTARGMKTDGVLPGGLGVRRRAPRSYRALCSQDHADPLTVIDWISLFAIAVNEENAAGGRVVTAPTNGSAGVIPAIGHYYEKFVDDANTEGLFRYFLTAGAIGILYKENARFRERRWVVRGRLVWRAPWLPVDRSRHWVELMSKWNTPPRLRWSTAWV